MHHYKIIHDDDLERVDVVSEDGEPTGETRPPTERELLNRDLLYVRHLEAGLTVEGEDGTHTTVEGDAIYLCASPDDMDDGRFPDGFRVSTGFLNQRHDKIKARAPELAGRMMKVRVVRNPTGDLRARLDAEIGDPAPGEPMAGRFSRGPEDPERAEKLRARAMELVGDEESLVVARTVFADEVAAGDVIDKDELYPVRIAGENSNR